MNNLRTDNVGLKRYEERNNLRTDNFTVIHKNNKVYRLSFYIFNFMT